MLTAYPHIQVDPEGVAHIEGTSTKVVEIVLDRLTHSWDADEIRRQHPHLTLAQIHSALAYYHDNRHEMDREIQQRLKREADLLDSIHDTDLRNKVNLKNRVLHIPL